MPLFIRLEYANISFSPPSDSQRKLKGMCDVWCCGAWTILTTMTHWWHPMWHHNKSPFCSCLSANQYSLPPPTWPMGNLPLAPRSIIILLQWSLLAVSQLSDDPVLHVKLTQRIGTWWKASILSGKELERERKDSLAWERFLVYSWLRLEVGGIRDAAPIQTLPGACKHSAPNSSGEIMGRGTFLRWGGTNSLLRKSQTGVKQPSFISMAKLHWNV